jgi:hypothetical protein
VQPAAFLWAGPAPPFIASSRDLQMQVARLRPSMSGSPNQYLGFPVSCLSREALYPYATAYLRNPPLAVASACAALSSTPRSS